jgi:hypothetical protein
VGGPEDDAGGGQVVPRRSALAECISQLLKIMFHMIQR